ncbi:unnamed protein product [Paramecium pentaurelia]|uniref:Uncharacterized protein n=1 Tax=Paramecium pentaurelia TaxID=43138 RepID=A0A8S1V6X9_9CILI|nr:unnamed protein product [Paramecium pentaurelia]
MKIIQLLKLLYICTPNFRKKYYNFIDQQLSGSILSQSHQNHLQNNMFLMNIDRIKVFLKRNMIELNFYLDKERINMKYVRCKN